MKTTNRYVITKIIQNEKGLHNGGYLELSEEEMQYLLQGFWRTPQCECIKVEKVLEKINKVAKLDIETKH